MIESATRSIDATRESPILEAADRLFYRRGIGAVTMAEVRDDAGVSLRRLYSTYPAKADLVAAWLEFRHVRWMAMYAGLVETRIAEGDTPVDAVFAALEIWMLETDFRGCGFINTYAELNDLTDGQRTIIRTHKRALAAYLQTVVPDTGQDESGGGERGGGLGPGATGGTGRSDGDGRGRGGDSESGGLAPLVDGAIVQASIFANAEPIHAARRMARLLI